MTRVKPGQRKRSYNPKVRTGCLTCKGMSRRLKCDEAKPACHRCTSTGRKCEGYLLIPPTRSRANSTDSRRSVTPGPSHASAGTPIESQLFQFFMDETLPSLTKFAPNPLWSDVVVGLCSTEKGINHAVLALAAFHKEFQARCLGSPQSFHELDRNCGLGQYNAAIDKLIRAEGAEARSADVYLISCVVFVAIEVCRVTLIKSDNLVDMLQFLRGNNVAAIRFARHGKQILNDLENGQNVSARPLTLTPTELANVLPMIELYFDAIESQILPHGWMNPTLNYQLPPAGETAMAWPTNTQANPFEDTARAYKYMSAGPGRSFIFNTVAEIRTMWNRNWHTLLMSMSAGQRINPEASNSMRDFVRFFWQYSAAFDSWALENASRLPKPESDTLALLDIQRRVFQSILAVPDTLPDRQMAWDKQLHLHTAIVESAEKILGVPAPTASDIPMPAVSSASYSHVPTTLSDFGDLTYGLSTLTAEPNDFDFSSDLLQGLDLMSHSHISDFPTSPTLPPPATSPFPPVNRQRIVRSQSITHQPHQQQQQQQQIHQHHQHPQHHTPHHAQTMPLPIINPLPSQPAISIAPSEATLGPEPESTYSPELGLTIPLLSTLHRCRDPTTRRRLLRLLRLSSRREGLWDTALIAAVGERVMRVEEEGGGPVHAAADIPHARRVIGFDVRVVDGDGNAAAAAASGAASGGSAGGGGAGDAGRHIGARVVFWRLKRGPGLPVGAALAVATGQVPALGDVVTAEGLCVRWEERVPW